MVVAACGRIGFDPTEVNTPDCVVPVGSACGGKLWTTDFSTDPTKAATHCDGVPDWALRGGGVFPVEELVDNTWQNPGTSGSNRVLDTHPAQPFITRVVIDTAIESTQLVPNGGHGAVFWINFDYDTTGTFAVVFADAELQNDNTQTLTLYTETGVDALVEIAQLTALPESLLAVHLDIDPSALALQYSLVDGASVGSASVTKFGPDAGDQWATLIAYNAAATLGPTTVEVCPE